MLVLLGVSWLLIGIVAAWLATVLSSDVGRRLGLALAGIAGAAAGGVLALSASGAFATGVAGGVIGAAAAVTIHLAGEDIRWRGPGLAV